MTELGEAVNKMMMDAFPQIVDVNFTSNMEALLDGIAPKERERFESETLFDVIL